MEEIKKFHEQLSEICTEILNQQLRNGKGQAEIAAAVGIDRSRISRLLSGKEAWTCHSGFRVLEAFGFSWHFAAYPVLSNPMVTALTAAGFEEIDRNLYKGPHGIVAWLYAGKWRWATDRHPDPLGWLRTPHDVVQLLAEVRSAQ